MNKELPGWRITSSHSIFDLKLRLIWNYRDLLLLLVRRDFVAFYKQTILGPVWFFVQPLLTTIMFTLVFGRMGGFSTDGLPGPLFYLAGITAWNYFADCITKTSTVFRDNASIFGKVYFPRLIMPFSIVISSLVRFGVQFLLFLIALSFYIIKGSNINLNVYAALFPLLVVMMGLLGLGSGMIISAMTTKYRDLAFLLSFGVQLLMYATTVIYPLSTVDQKYSWLVKLNPTTSIIETFRFGFLGRGSFNWSSLGYSAAVTLLLLIIGTIVFNKVEKNFIDTV